MPVVSTEGLLRAIRNSEERRRVQPKPKVDRSLSAARHLFPHLNTDEQHRANEVQKEKDWRAKKGRW